MVGNSSILTSNLFWISSSTVLSSSELTKVIASPLVPNLPARPTL